MKKKLIAFINVMVLIGCACLYADSISTSFNEILVENLKPGSSYSLSKIANYPYNIKNKGDRRIKIKIEPVKSDKSKLRKQFQNIPDINWIKMDPEHIELNPGEIGYSDIVIAIPDENEYYGKKYQVNILSETINPGGFAVGLAVESRLLFTTPEKGIRINNNQKSINLNYRVNPSSHFITNIKINNSQRLVKKDYFFTITNESKDTLELNIKALKVKDTLDKQQRGYEDIPDLSMVKLKDNKVVVNKGEKIQIGFELQIPDIRYFKGKKYQFIIYTFSGEQTNTSGKYTKVFLNL